MNPNHKKNLLLTGLATLLLPLAAVAQSTALTNESTTTSFGGRHEITIGGGGSSDKDLDGSFGSVDVGYGTYLSPRSVLVVRQSLAYNNPDNGDNGWSGSTRLAYDYHFSESTTRPFLGISAGRIYGNSVNDSWTAGLEGGAKFFVKPQTFILAMVSYDWLFDHGDDIDDQFESGRFGWTLGVGFQF